MDQPANTTIQKRGMCHWLLALSTHKDFLVDRLEKKISQTNAKIEKMEFDMKIKEDLKTVALGTSKINYLDPRISVAWCKCHEVRIEKGCCPHTAGYCDR